MLDRPRGSDVSESEYRAIFEASSDGLVVNDLDTGLVLEANPAFCNMHGYTSMTGLHPSLFIHPNSGHLFEAFMRAVRDGGEFRGVAQDIHRDGTVFDVEVLGRTFTYRGKPATLGVVRDVTERTRAYEVLEQRVAERTREVERRREVAEGMRELLAVINSGRTLDDILGVVLRQASRLLDSDASAIYLLDGDRDALDLRASYGAGAVDLAPSIPVGRPATGLAVVKQRPVAFADLAAILPSHIVPHTDTQLEDRSSYLKVLRLGSGRDPDVETRDLARMRRLAARHPAVLAVPLALSGVVGGTITLFYSQPREFGDEEVALASAFADQAALAIENARVHAQSDQRLAELDGLYRADELLHRSLRLDDVLQALVDVAADMLRADKTSVLVWDARHERLSARAAHGFEPETVRQMSFVPGEGISARVAASGEAIAIYDLVNDPRIPPRIQAINEAAALRSLVSVPIKLSGEVFGVFNVNSTAPRIFGDGDVRMLSALAQRAALAIQNARVHGESEQRRYELEALYRADEALHRSLRLRDVLDALVDAAIGLLRADGAGVWGADQLQGPSTPLASRGLSSDYLEQTVAMNADPRIQQLWWAQESLVVEDVALDPRIPPVQREALLREGYSSLLSTRVRVGDDVFGSFTVGYRAPHAFDEAEQRLLAALAQRAGLAIQNARLYEQAQQAATLEERQRLARELHDAVTQTLFSTALLAEVLPELWDTDPVEGRQRLAELRRLTRGALAEMRTLLVELRPGALTEIPLADLLRQLAEATAGRTRLEVATSVEGAPRRLAASVQVGLYRMAQEGLNNIVKHAQARHASIRLHYEQSGGVLEIEDDGRGFDPATIPPGHLGLGIMRERAEAMSASFSVSSAPGGGTSINVHWHDERGIPP